MNNNLGMYVLMAIIIIEAGVWVQLYLNRKQSQEQHRETHDFWKRESTARSLGFKEGVEAAREAFEKYIKNELEK